LRRGRGLLGLLLAVAELGQPAQPGRQPPVGPAEQGHDRGQQDGAHQGGVEEDRDGEADTELLEVLHGQGAEDREDGDHDESGAGDDPGGGADAVGDRGAVVDALVVGLADPGDHEDVVVHRQSEQDDEDEQRHPGLDGADGCRADQFVAPALLEHGGHHAVGGDHGQQVEDDRGEGDDRGAEAEQHQQEADAHHEGEDGHDRRLELVVVVRREGQVAADQRLVVRVLAQGGGDDVAAQLLKGTLGGGVAAVAGERGADDRDVLVRVDGDLDGVLDVAGGEGALLEAVEGAGGLGGGDVVGLEDDLGRCRGTGEDGFDPLRGPRGDVVGREQLVEAELLRLHGQRRRGEGQEEGGAEDGEEGGRAQDGAEQPARLLVRGADGGPAAQAGDPSGVDPVAEHRHHGGQHGHGAEHRDEDDLDGGDGEALEHGEAGEEHAGHGDGDREAGDQHRAAGGRGGDAQRALLVPAGGALLAFAADVEEAVVDTDGQAHQQQHRVGHGVDRDELAGQGEQAHGGDARGDGEDQRQEGGDERAEHDEEDAEGDGHGGELGAGEVLAEGVV